MGAADQNYDEAFKWFMKAAEQGLGEAQYMLGMMHYEGRGTHHDYEKAARWFHKAAEQGDASAQYALGFMYNNGFGVPVDYIEAYKWISIVLHRNDAAVLETTGIHGDWQFTRFSLEAGFDLRDSLRRQMSEKQIAEAQRHVKGLELRFPASARRTKWYEWWERSLSLEFGRPETRIAWIGRMWVFLLLWIIPAMLVGALVGGAIYGNLKGKMAYVVEMVVGGGIISVICVLALGIRKVWRTYHGK